MSSPARRPGTVPAVLALAGRGALPYALLHKVPLYLHALRALAASGDLDIVLSVDEADRRRVEGDVRRAGVVAEVRTGRGWWERVGAGQADAGLLVHDSLCPLAAAGFIRSVRDGADGRSDLSVLAFRPVTDTVKTVVDSRIHGTIDREALAALVAPAMVSPAALAAAVAEDDAPPLDDFARLAGWLRGRGEVELVRAPSLARRVDDASSVNLLECVDELTRQVRRDSVTAAASDAAGPGTR